MGTGDTVLKIELEIKCLRNLLNNRALTGAGRTNQRRGDTGVNSNKDFGKQEMTRFIVKNCRSLSNLQLNLIEHIHADDLFLDQSLSLFQRRSVESLTEMEHGIRGYSLNTIELLFKLI